MIGPAHRSEKPGDALDVLQQPPPRLTSIAHLDRIAGDKEIAELQPERPVWPVRVGDLRALHGARMDLGGKDVYVCEGIY